jgi:phosphoribosyl-AMP cyclohydrolase
MRLSPSPRRFAPLPTWLVFVTAFAACSKGSAGDAPTAPPAPVDPPPPPASAVVPAAPDALDFAKEAKAIFRVVVCGSDDPLPKQLDAKVVEAHCAKMSGLVDTLKSGWLAYASPFLAGLRPKQLPSQVVYPFGGGDLMWAITTFPDAAEYTTISLEVAGDPRGIDGIDAAKLAQSYRVNEKNVALQFKVSHSRTDNLTIGAGDVVPSELVLDLMAASVYGLEPAMLRYFDIADSGDLVYLTQKKLDATPAAKQAALFSNMEVVLRPKGDPSGRTQILRHIAYDLSDDNNKRHPGLLKHLEQKGKVAAMTKAATYLLWSTAFSKVRDYLLQNMVWMVSDSTGVPPKVAAAAGFVQETYGRYEKPFLDWPNKTISEEFAAMWRSQPRRDLPMIYGYPDGNHHWHLMVTRPASTAELAARAAPAAAETATATPAKAATSPTTAVAAPAPSSPVAPAPAAAPAGEPATAGAPKP